MPVPKDEQSNHHIPKVIFELGRLVCYTYQTQLEILEQKPSTSIYWKFKDLPEHNGPFATIYQAMQHYTHILESTKAVSIKDLGKGSNNVIPLPVNSKSNVIPVDFKSKKRV